MYMLYYMLYYIYTYIHIILLLCIYIILGQQIDNEDDVLHIRDLPNFDNTLGSRDCELMLQYLTAPYIRIPLLLNFFSVESRLQALRNPDLQEVLDAALFEPGTFKPNANIDVPTDVPAANRSHLFTPTGLLFNEIIIAPQVVLTAVTTMLEKVIDMDTGKDVLYRIHCYIYMYKFLYIYA